MLFQCEMLQPTPAQPVIIPGVLVTAHPQATAVQLCIMNAPSFRQWVLWLRGVHERKICKSIVSLVPKRSSGCDSVYTKKWKERSFSFTSGFSRLQRWPSSGHSSCTSTLVSVRSTSFSSLQLPRQISEKVPLQHHFPLFGRHGPEERPDTDS